MCCLFVFGALITCVYVHVRATIVPAVLHKGATTMGEAVLSNKNSFLSKVHLLCFTGENAAAAAAFPFKL